MQGPTLASLLHLDGIIPQHLAVEYAAQIADALDCAYSERNVIHRDIKPENLMLDRWGKIKVMDFGLARATGHQRITVARTLVGSLYYASPEQVWGQTLDNRSDIYALGVVLYEMVSGHRPFTGRSMPELTQNIISGQLQPPGIYNPELLPELAQIILTAIARDRNYRYANARLLAEQLRALHLQAPTVFYAIQLGNTTASPILERIVIHPPKRPQHKRPLYEDVSINETTSEAHKLQNQYAFPQEAAIDPPTLYAMPEYPLSTPDNRQSVEEAQPPTQALVLLPTQTHPQKQARRSFWAILARWLRPTSRP